LFGIELSPNFAQPFLSRSFTEFWSRWHISLSLWLRDYVYLPLSRAILRRDPRRWNVRNLVVPPMAAMVVCGRWHGVEAGMVAWGALHGAYLTVERVALLRHGSRPAARGPVRTVLAVGAVFALGCLALVPFRTGLPVAVEYWRALALNPTGEAPDWRLF